MVNTGQPVQNNSAEVNLVPRKNKKRTILIAAISAAIVLVLAIIAVVVAVNLGNGGGV